MQKLENLCRLCGKSTQHLERTKKTQYAKELYELFSIDVTNEDNNIFPLYLCQTCRCYLYRQRKSGPKRPKTIPSIQLKEYVPHSDLCKLCKYEDERCESDAETTINKIVSSFHSLSHSEQLKCLRQLIESLYVGKNLKSKIKDVTNNYPYNQLQTIEHLQLSKYIESFDEFLINAILAFTGQKRDTVKLQHFVPLLESVYRISDPKFIGAWSFMQNLITFSTGKSKQACNVLGTAIPGSKYSNIAAFLNNTETGREADCPDGDVVFMFDNEQVIGKSWSVTAQNKVKMSVITNVAVLKLENSNNQQIEHFMPGYWLTSEGKEGIITELCKEPGDQPAQGLKDNNFFQNIKKEHYKELYRTLDIVIEQIQEELITDPVSGKKVDFIDKAVTQMEIEKKFKKCPKCGCLLELKKRKCHLCKISITEFQKKMNPDSDQHHVKTVPSRSATTGTSSGVKIKHHLTETEKESKPSVIRYNHVNSSHSGLSTDVILLDPVFLNPNSIDNIILVLRHIARKAKIAKYYKDCERPTDARYWTFVCCDGLPHGLVRKLIEEYLVCSVCETGILGIHDAQKHAAKHTGSGITANFVREFDWIFLLTGEGHYEMNLMKSFMELNWNVFMKTLVEAMGWSSERAQQCALNCTDNHKTWQMILIFHTGTLLELVKPYVEKCSSENIQPTAEGYISFVKSQAECSNYMYLFEMACKYSQGIINMRMAIRRNNHMLLQAAKWMTKELFHGRRHPRYQEIEIYEQFMFQILPDELSSFIQRHCSVSKSGHLSRGQGFDFILEEENKTVKTWLKRGVPTDRTWLTTCRNHQSLKQMRQYVLQMSSQSNAETADRELKLEDAINEWRLRLRQTEYLKPDKHGSVLTSISADILDQGLSQFTTESNRKRGYRIMDMLLHQAPPSDPSLEHPVYILPSERKKLESVESMSISDIDNKILDIIEDLGDYYRHMYTDLFSKMLKNKSVRKHHHIQFLQDISKAASGMEAEGVSLLAEDDAEEFE